MKGLIRSILTVLVALIFLAVAAWGIVRYLYPKQFEATVSRYSDEYGISEELIYGVIKCESGFDTDAVSAVGARGLMQLMPETFDWVQKKLDGEILHEAEALFDPEVNLKYGIYLLKLLKEEFVTDELTLAAYHAGRGQVNAWLSDPTVSPDGKSLAHIPFDDTRLYVEKVANAVLIYKTVYKN